MQESLDYQAAVDKSDKIGNPIKFAYKHHKITLLICLGLICNHAISFYFVFMFLPVFLAKVRMMPESAALVNNTWFLLIHLIFIPILGYFVSFINGKNNIRISCLLFLALTFPLCSLLAFAEQKYILLGLLIFSILTALNAAVVPGLLAEITPARVRYTIVSFTFNLGFGVLGGVTPFLSLLLLHDFGNIFAAATYLAIGALITLFASFFLKANGREVATRYETREISGVR